jgi:urease accessory protein
VGVADNRVFGKHGTMNDDDDDETFILLVLSDSSLPTGSFVASSGLESYFKHGFPSLFPSSEHALVSFIRQSLPTYARSALPFVTDAHRIISAAKDSYTTLTRLLALDQLYEASNLNHVARRASTSQGVALLTLFSKGLSKPPIHADIFKDGSSPSQQSSLLSSLVGEFKLLVRREETPGHLPVCWGVLTGALDLSLGSHRYSALSYVLCR